MHSDVHLIILDGQIPSYPKRLLTMWLNIDGAFMDQHIKQLYTHPLGTGKQNEETQGLLCSTESYSKCYVLF